MLAGPAATLLSIMVIAALALLSGGIWMIGKRGDGKRGALMLLAALVMIANVLIWTL